MKLMVVVVVVIFTRAIIVNISLESRRQHIVCPEKKCWRTAAQRRQELNFILNRLYKIVYSTSKVSSRPALKIMWRSNLCGPVCIWEIDFFKVQTEMTMLKSGNKQNWQDQFRSCSRPFKRYMVACSSMYCYIFFVMNYTLVFLDKWRRRGIVSI